MQQLLLVVCCLMVSVHGLSDHVMQQEIFRFAVDNGMRFVTVVGNHSTLKSAHGLARHGGLYVRASKLADYVDKKYVFALDSQVFLYDAKAGTYKILHLMVNSWLL